jgi:hypothetical protein
MKIEDIKKAKEEAEKFIKFVEDFLIAEKQRIEGTGWYLSCPAESGLVKAQSLILSRQLATMRNPYSCKRGKRK